MLFSVGSLSNKVPRYVQSVCKKGINIGKQTVIKFIPMNFPVAYLYATGKQHIYWTLIMWTFKISIERKLRILG